MDYLRRKAEIRFAKEEMPEKPKGINLFTLVRRMVAARRIQNSWIIYQYTKRELRQEQEMDAYNAR
jgi:hypothetical protein